MLRKSLLKMFTTSTGLFLLVFLSSSDSLPKKYEFESENAQSRVGVVKVTDFKAFGGNLVSLSASGQSVILSNFHEKIQLP